MTNETTASQPKSIGDDAQFRNLLFAYLNVGTTRQQHDVYSKIIAHIDSRAPAAQASATIQAAPEGYKLMPVDPATQLGLGWAYLDAARADDPSSTWRFSHAGYRAMIEAATIQEPVMVAEPVENCPVCEEGTLVACHFHWCNKCGVEVGTTEDATENARITKSLTAPMVADPAGVALSDGEIIAICNRIDPRPFRDNDLLALNFARAIESALAATVKAAPSEALSELRSQMAFIAAYSLDELDALSYDQIRVRARSIIQRAQRAIAAPLANKTGGGE